MAPSPTVKPVYYYTFNDRVSMVAVEDSLSLAALATESLVGSSLFALETEFRVDKEHRECVINADTACGKALAAIFTGFLDADETDGQYDIERRQAVFAPEKEVRS
jgi:hypothetical protein